MSEVYIGGIEGGSTHSYAVVMNSAGEIVGNAKGDSTNPFLVGLSECQVRIADMINRCKKVAGIQDSVPISALGLSLSGCEHEENNKKFAATFRTLYPNIAEQVIVGSDTEGSVAATSNKGGVVCIAGTGSNTLLINPDGRRIQCGGWGYLIGDEGSAWKISYQAVKYCFDDLDNFAKAPHPIDKVWALIQEHFKIKTQPDILDSFYKDFDKAYISSLCKKLSELARNGDSLAQKIFDEAGSDIAQNICAVVPKAAKELIERDGGIHILCVGSVWLSWELLSDGFVNYVRDKSKIEKLSLMRGTTDMGVGAAYMASDRLNMPLYRDYSKNYKVFYRFDRSKCKITNGTT